MCPCTLLVAPMAEHEVLHRKHQSRARAALLPGQEDRVCWAETRRKTGPLWGLRPYGVKHPARKHTEIMLVVGASISHPCSCCTTVTSPWCTGTAAQVPSRCSQARSHSALSHQVPHGSQNFLAPLLLLPSPSPRATPTYCPRAISHPSRTCTTPSTSGISTASPGSSTGFGPWEAGMAASGGQPWLSKSLLHQAGKSWNEPSPCVTLPEHPFSSFLQSLGGQEECLII